MWFPIATVVRPCIDFLWSSSQNEMKLNAFVAWIVISALFLSPIVIDKRVFLRSTKDPFARPIEPITLWRIQGFDGGHRPSSQPPNKL